jgi:hypothetical protein
VPRTGAHQALGMVPVSEFTDSDTAVAVRSSCSCTGSVPFKPAPESQSAAMPPTGFAFEAQVVGLLYTTKPLPAFCQSWQYSALPATDAVETYFQPAPYVARPALCIGVPPRLDQGRHGCAAVLFQLGRNTPLGSTAAFTSIKMAASGRSSPMLVPYSQPVPYPALLYDGG